MKPTLTLLLLGGALTMASAQKREAVQMTEQYNDVSQMMSRTTQYLLPAFDKGMVIFKNGETAAAQLNYNMLLEQMQFMESDSSILAIANLDEVMYVSIGKRFFVKLKTQFIEVIMDGSELQLGVARKLRIVDHRKDGGYGGTTSLMKVESVSTLSGASADHLVGTEEIVYEESATYYLIAGGKPKVASKKVFAKAFPACKESIDKQDVDYSNEAQLRALFVLCKP
ncbi:MAG: hypothetical protein LBS94_04750 [Prevotellaceae bacterium]|jgi:hypothetical protein|nr:hypothetical protein [Prevotellaceae bacterium]